MSTSPSVQWSEQEQESGAVSFSKHLSELREKLVTTTTTSPSTTSTHSTVEKLVHVVDTVVPQLVESIRHEFIETSTPAAPAVVTSPAPPTSTFTPTTITTTPPSTPPTFCNPVDSAHVQVN
jgi:hypothetical protein